MSSSSEASNREQASSNAESNQDFADKRTDDAIAYDNSLDLVGSQEDFNDDVIRAIIRQAAIDKAAGRENGWNSKRSGWNPRES